VELAGRPALPGHGDHLGVEVDADRAGPAPGQLGDRAATAAADVDHGPAGEVAEQLVGTCAQLDGHGLRVAGIEDSRAAVQAMEAAKDRFARFRGRLETLVDLLAGPGAPLRARVRASTAVLAVGATCHFYLQEVDDPDKLRAIILETATDLIH
jgi:hypothetical protein